MKLYIICNEAALTFIYIAMQILKLKDYNAFTRFNDLY